MKIVDISEIPIPRRKGKRLEQIRDVMELPVGKGFEIDKKAYGSIVWQLVMMSSRFPGVKAIKRGDKYYLMHVGPEATK